VGFTVNANGSPATCSIALNGGAASAIGCNGGNVGGLWPGNTYNFSVSAVNKAGSAGFTGSVTTPQVTGTVVCTNDSYCGHGNPTGGIWVYKTPNQTSGQEVGHIYAPTQVTAQCQTTGGNVNAQPYGGRSTNVWLRISYNGNNYIPYAWVNLNNGAALGNLPHC
jgi:hypothetical protein